MNLRVVSLNLRYDEPRDGENSWTHRIGRVAATLQSHRPLIVGTQEGLQAMLEALSGRMPGYAWIGEGRQGGRADEHCAIFYDAGRLELREQGQFWLSERPELAGSKSWDSSLPRICTWAKLRERDAGREFRFYNTHLDHMGEQARLESARLLVRRMAADSREDGLPAVLTGDFNSEPGDAPMRFLRGELELDGARSGLQDAFSATSGPVGATFHDFQGGTEGPTIDYIFVTPAFGVAEIAVDRQSFEGRYPSDHYPVAATLTL
ncbi:endonuclease/exonuclease/phosphatase family protein [Cohnella nanjingensis]|uniref:Endonuclease/exonuclease/phosphatase family protein n=1 Tax=Cohnella nanjingensis TaxID=1387779 RepID=A0A7X0RVZ8_9BACL|nr:endonuclease/exonuclease/phosphatase family protein [Cohnella nanjingensis]MBB6674687.1 endonuclease/exonuclease/phosphatase family protein [Cohnella nanjingensis]